MNTNPLVSIVIPCYNQAKFLPDTLNSVLKQSYTNWECIIVNDGSQDNTEEVSLSYSNADKRIQYKKKENGGLSNARNEGLKRCSGEFIQFLDADDLIEEEKIAQTINSYVTLAAVNKLIIYTSSRYFDDGNSSTLKIFGRNGFIGNIELKHFDTLASQNQALRIRNICAISAPLYPKKVFETIGLYDEELKAFEDWDINLRCSDSGYLFHHESLKNAFTLIRLHDNSMMTGLKRMNNNHIKFALKHKLREYPIPTKLDKIKSVIKSFIPPIIFKVLK